jgi:CPA2 family monovalent cation:H+ antiporter-2
VLGFAAVASIALGLPVVPLYITAGLALGGLIPPSDVVPFLGSLGVVFLLFSMGLDFSPGARGVLSGRALGAGTVDLVVNFPLGLALGLVAGWSWEESLFLAGIVYMTSSAVVTKCIVDLGRAARPETETILAIMVYEDFAIAFYLVLLSVLVPGVDGEAPHAAVAIARALAFVGALGLAAWQLDRALERWLAPLAEEAFTLLLFALVLGLAATAQAAGLSLEIGALLSGLVLGRTGLRERAARTLLPFQTVFAALFFVSFGMGLDLASFAPVLPAATLFVLVGLTAKTVGGFFAGRAAGHPPRLAAVVGLSLIPKGEFSIVLASAAAAAKPGSPLEPFAGIYVLALSILGPIAMREADRVRDWLFPRKGTPRFRRRRAPTPRA